ncbi:TonB-dependent receptor plug domain-containing protein [Acetonema longum]|uniref:TonB-dependent receptor plug n=1 Tax=Acetonema longum DSM 6540 TaxID=1009370 RepID=F7NPU2_9FIRM|nr:TonB-dependent receptor [Acetonema longum]EGO61933.1 TonB-dependent receptor plug [Acetonema longum DSM 6540]
MRKESVLTRKILAATAAAGMLLGGQAAGLAAEGEAQDFELDQVIVTAQRYEKREVDVAASTEILTQQDLLNTGASNLYNALSFSTGIALHQYGTGGSSMGNMTSKIVMRGNSGGTLVLINGMPLNIRGTYDLNDIPVENIERVEIVRGGGSVLYGSEATGGVINIITKKQRENYFKTGWGNYGQQEYTVGLQADRLGLSYQYSDWGTRENVASDGKKWKGPDNNNLSLNYAFNDNWSLSLNHVESNYHYITSKADTEQNINRNNIQLTYRDNHLQSTFYYVDRTREKDALTFSKGTYEIDEEKNRNYGLDMQKDWEIKDTRLLFGGSFQREEFTKNAKISTSDSVKHSRNDFSAYGQYEKPISKRDTLILSARESWTTGAPNDYDETNFSGQAQMIHKLQENENLYISAGQSFKMPELHQIYNTAPGADLKAQVGAHYEAGWKKDIGGHKWRVALFHYDIDDNITAKYVAPDFIYENENLKNSGIELECKIKTAASPFGFHYAVSYGNPKTETIDEGGSSGWQRDYSRWQLNGGVTYQQDKWSAALNASYMAERVLNNVDTKPYLLTNLNVNYAMTQNSSLFLTINNLLDRDDITYRATSADYYFTPCNYMMGYKMNF